MAEGDPIPLTEQELELLQLIADGATSLQAATALGLSPMEVRISLGVIFEKVGPNDRPPEPGMPPLRPAS